MIITNFKELARSPLREKALLMAEAGYKAIGIEKSVRERISLKDNLLKIKDRSPLGLSNFQRIFIIGIGKGSALASAALAKILGKHLTAGIALDIQPLKAKSCKLKAFVGTHPLPSIQNVKATQKIIELARGLTEKDLLITFICGGGSALGCGSIKEMRQSISATKALTRAGADIHELNTVRKHLSDFKGGELAKNAYPATVISLIASDVLGNDLSMVASGPTVFDKTTKKDAEKVLKKYQRKSAYLSALISVLRETPKNRKYFRNVRNILFISNKDAVSAMEKRARQLKLNPKIYSLTLRGEAKKSLLPLIRKVNVGEAVLAGGETTVNLGQGKTGRGGRNQEAVLGYLSNASRINSNESRIRDSLFEKILVMSFASDGRDNTEAAGAIGDQLVLKKAERLRLSAKKFLMNHNSFNFFKKTNDLIFAKPKSFNISDLMLILKA